MPNSVEPSGAYSSPSDLHAVGRGVRLDDLVGGAREDVVAADQEDLLLALLLEVVQAGDDLLVGGRAGVEDVRRLLQALVLHGVEQQRLVLLEDRQHRPCGWPRSSSRRRRRPCPR